MRWNLFADLFRFVSGTRMCPVGWFHCNAALGDERLQVITNQIYAQLVPHVSRNALHLLKLDRELLSDRLGLACGLTLAAQVHFHIVPAAMRASSDGKEKKPASTNPLAAMGLGHGREELDDEEAEELCRKMRQAANELDKQPNAKL